MGTHDGAIDEMEVPVHPAGVVGLLLEGGQDAVPDARPAPAVEAAGDRLGAAVALREVLPRCPAAQNPLDAVDDAPMVMIGPPGAGLLGRQPWLPPQPLLVSKVIAMHSQRVAGFAQRP
jgi:hypothetical protein